MLKAQALLKHYPGAERPAVDRLDLQVRAGEFLSITGPSGSGKSTLLHILSSLIRPDSGSVCFQGKDISSAGEKERNRLRAGAFAVVFQQHHLLPYLSALENVLLPCLDSLLPIREEKKSAARALLRRVGLERRANARPGELSGGEQQRVAIARALARGARVLFADEPTGSLDAASGSAIMELLRELNTDGLTIVMVTHNPEFAARADRTARLEDGRLSL